MSELSYKPVPERDYDEFARVQAQAFLDEPRRVREWLAGDCVGEPRGLYLDGRLVAQLVLLPLHVQTGGGVLPFGGLGAVASPPEGRRRGHMGRLLRELCGELRERRIWLGILKPFKASFYQQFGWATFEERRIYSASPGVLATFRRQRQGRFELAGEAQIADLDAIYRGALRGRFGPIVRDQRWWRREVLNLEKGDTYGYVWRDGHGAGRSYVIYRFEQRPAGLAMVCREAVALDPTARAQLFALMSDHDSQCQEVVFRAPADAPVQALMPETLGCEVRPHFQLRLLDVAQALAAYHYPKDVAGRLTIAVADRWLEHNQGVFELEVSEGRACCQRLPDGSTADLACDVRVLAQLYARYVRPRTAAAFGLLNIHSRPALALADRLFAGLGPFCSDSF